MDVVVKYLDIYNFKRLSSKLELPIIVHCVPGAGKSSCIRDILAADSRFVAYTAGVPDTPNLSGRWIKAFKGNLEPGKFCLVDEYTLISEPPTGAFALFGDPLQSNLCIPRAAHFISNFSRRFGRATAEFLQHLGYQVEAEGEDCVQVAGIYQEDPRDQVIYFEDEVGALLCRHGVAAKNLDEIVGQTFDSVTFVTSLNSPSSRRVECFQCLTRHRRNLLVLCPDATFAST